MGYVIYNRATKRIASKTYKTHAAAQAVLTRWSRKWFSESLENATVDYAADPVYNFGIAEEAYYAQNIRTTVTRVNLMTGQEYEEDVNTPLACSPASETYWSM